MNNNIFTPSHNYLLIPGPYNFQASTSDNISTDWNVATATEDYNFGTWAQGGILAGKVARILPGSLEVSGEVLSKNHALLSRFWDMTKNHALLSRFYIRGMKCCHKKRFPVSGRNFLWHKEISCDIKKFPIIGRNVLSMEEISSDRNREKEIPGHIKKFPVAGWSFLSLDKISCHRKKFPVTGRYL